MKTLNRIISAMLGVLIATGAMAEKPETTLFAMNGSCNYYKTHFTLASHLVVLPFRINGSDTLNLIFDSGTGRTLITELSTSDGVSFNETRKVKLRGLGNNLALEGVLSSGNEVSLGEIRGRDQEVLIIPNNVIDFSARAGQRINGIIGQSIFEQYVVEISYTNKTAIFYNPEKFNRKIRRGDEVIPLEIINGKPYITAMVTIHGKKFPVKLLFDTGMSFAVWLDPNSNALIGPGELCRREVLGQGLNGELTGVVSRIEKLQIGGFDFSNVVTAFPDSSSIGEATLENGRNGSVGSEILRRFNVVIDYHNRRLILRKNNDYRAPFHYDMSGMEIGSVIAGFPFYRILNISDASPAAETDLRVDDELYAINGTLASKMTMIEIVELLRSKEGRKIRMTVMRNGESVKVVFKLRKLI